MLIATDNFNQKLTLVIRSSSTPPSRIIISRAVPWIKYRYLIDIIITDWLQVSIYNLLALGTLLALTSNFNAYSKNGIFLLFFKAQSWQTVDQKTFSRYRFAKHASYSYHRIPKYTEGYYVHYNHHMTFFFHKINFIFLYIM